MKKIDIPENATAEQIEELLITEMLGSGEEVCTNISKTQEDQLRKQYGLDPMEDN